MYVCMSLNVSVVSGFYITVWEKENTFHSPTVPPPKKKKKKNDKIKHN